MQDSLFSRASAAPVIEPVQGVSRVVDYIRRLIAQNKTLASIRVRGEVSNLSNRNGRLYFDLKENTDVLKCVVWASETPKLAPFKDGDEVICGGEYGTYAARSQYQLFIKSVELTGIGALYAQFEALKQKFRAEGLFDEGRKRPLPPFPRRVALVSAKGKGAEDFLTTIAKRASFIDVTFVETRLQGDGAQIDIAEAIDKASKLDVDVIVLTRGGGSYEDLFPFNLEPVVRAIVRARRPVLSAIGHTGDVHLSDYVADYACETPSNAAQYFGEIGDRFLGRVQTAHTQLERSLRAALSNAGQRLDSATKDLRHSMQSYVPARQRALALLERRLNKQTPQQRLAQRFERLSTLRTQLTSAGRYYAAPHVQRVRGLREGLDRLHSGALRAQGERLRHFETLLTALDPKALLARGYAIVTFDGRAVRDPAVVPKGAQIQAHVQHGKLIAVVEGHDLE
jgi:exodeoxyribonuclease VII large subunit